MSFPPFSCPFLDAEVGVGNEINRLKLLDAKCYVQPYSLLVQHVAL
jgi:hypothetical protein